MLEINKKVEWALSEKARLTVLMMTDYGIDADLAFALLEQVWPENQIYNLPTENEND